ncbi:MAG: sialate O-acetylesterase [Bacteroidota bacterium]
MCRKLFFKIVSIAIMTPLLSPQAWAQVKLPRLISDGMVLQRDRPVRIWGWAAAGERVTVNLNNQVYTTKANADRHWEIKLHAMPAGGPYQMVISGQNKIVLDNILFGDVWLCSGQSNMEFNMNRAKDKYAAEIAGSTNTNIRQFLVKANFSFQPKDDLASSGWLSADPQNILRFTAVGYFFAKSLYEKYHVPIGLIHSSVGGTPAEAWTSADGLKELPNYLEKIEPYKDSTRVAAILANNTTIDRDWNQQVLQRDSGFAQNGRHWTDGIGDGGRWDTISIPGSFRGPILGHFAGVIWLKRTVTLPAGNPQDAVLQLGMFADRDSTYVNRQRVGYTPSRYLPRKYIIPASVLHPGENTIMIRIVVSTSGSFVDGKSYELQYGNTTLLLTGKWLYRIAFTTKPLPAMINLGREPTALYNAMIAPIVPFTIKGAIWYQGEANTTEAAAYKPLFQTMITDWRKKWGEGDFPFFFVQLANLGAPPREPGQSNWAELRESQSKALQLKNTGMAVTHDLGEPNDIHPLNKMDVGYRLSLAARKIAYKEKGLVFSGPTYKSVKFSNNLGVVKFETHGSSLVVKNGGSLKGFQVAGANHEYYWANAKIDGDKVVVRSDVVKNPIAVRYAWANNPDGANLYNSEGLPASSFRTDEW